MRELKRKKRQLEHQLAERQKQEQVVKVRRAPTRSSFSVHEKSSSRIFSIRLDWSKSKSFLVTWFSTRIVLSIICQPSINWSNKVVSPSLFLWSVSRDSLFSCLRSFSIVLSHLWTGQTLDYECPRWWFVWTCRNGSTTIDSGSEDDRRVFREQGTTCPSDDRRRHRTRFHSISKRSEEECK